MKKYDSSNENNIDFWLNEIADIPDTLENMEFIDHYNSIIENAFGDRTHQYRLIFAAEQLAELYRENLKLSKENSELSKENSELKKDNKELEGENFKRWFKEQYETR